MTHDGILYSRGYLPHISRPGRYQSVTFRLADSLPQEVIREMRRAAEEGEPHDFAFVEAVLDSGHGACHLRDPRLAKVVADALRFFDGERYELVAWTIMPNHVHVLMKLVEAHSTASILQSWKAFTARRCNEILGRAGRFWQRDYWDTYIRTPVHLREVRDYIEQNPVTAGLCRLPEEWPWGSASLREAEL